MVALEVFHSMGQASKHNSLMVIKADIDKAYDKVSWRYLTTILTQYGFHMRFINWILCCILNPSFREITNSVPYGWFSSFMSLRLGFLLVVFLIHEP